MTNLLNTKVLLSGAMIVAAAAVVIGATFAFFSDTETSANNSFTAGSIDLSLGGEFSSTNNVNGGPFTSVLLADNDGRALYNFTDLKPGDNGQGSFNLQVTSNDAYVCSLSEITSTPDNGINEPEAEADDITDGLTGGELQNYLQVATFADLDNDGTYDAGVEPVNANQYGLGDSNGFTLAEVEAAGWVPVADPTNTPNTWLTIGSILANTEYSAGMLYCYGNFTNDGGVGPALQVTGCDGTSASGNVAQTDSVVGSIQFYAVQSRNNPSFDCTQLPLPEQEG